MKKFKFLTMALAIFILSCENDGGTSNIPLNDGAAPNLIKSASTDGFFNLIRLNNGENVSIDFYAEVAQGNPAKTDIVGSYKTAGGLVYNTTLFGDVTLPQDFSLSINDIITVFSEINVASDIEVGDVLTITTRFTMNDGTVLNILNENGTSAVSSNIQTTVLFDSVISYPVSCPSDLGGTYNVVSSGYSTDGAPINNPLVNFPYTVTVTDDGGGSYTISDGVAGVYQDWYCVPYGYCFETEGNFTDVCNNLSGSWTEAFGCPVELIGMVNADRTLTISWSNCFGDTIEQAIYTPQ
ncbi:MAG: hypothetical protein P8O96_05250 [Flavobacteriaceae bacterium]|nr:hypothetical protein [Flavobacteriaceae bacterium]MDG1042236.1 hypothetical protein [Flavobacteriaceae bacterium]